MTDFQFDRFKWISKQLRHALKYKHWSHPQEEWKFPAVKADPEKLGFKTLLFHDVVIIRCLHFLYI